ncbi:MAG: PRC-barrel domain-containing protein [Candidatus Thorarchaeota archaeon]
MKLARSLCCKEMKKADVVDSSGNKVGNVGDMTFTFDKELKLSKFILAGPRFEEFLESIKVKPDKDPVFDGSLITKVDEKVHLDTSVNSLKTTLDKDAIPQGDIRLSQLEKMDIVDNTGKKIGRAIDVDFDVDGSASMIVGGGFIEEKLEAAGLKADVDIIVPGSVISSISDKICLSVSESELATTMDDALKSDDVKKAREAKTVHHEVTKVRLYSHRPM